MNLNRTPTFLASLLALVAQGAKSFNAAMQPAASWRGATQAKHRKEKTRYVVGLQRYWAKKRREAMPKVGVLRDEHGAYTLVGRQQQGSAPDNSDYKPRRKWLGGISAQRGY